VASLSAAKDRFAEQLKERSKLIDDLFAKIGDFDGLLRSLLPVATAVENSAEAQSSTEAITGEEAVLASISQEEEGVTDVN